MGKSPDEQPFLAAYKLRLAKLTLVPITRQLLTVICHMSNMYPKKRASWVGIMINFDRPDHCHDHLNWIERSGVKHKYINI